MTRGEGVPPRLSGDKPAVDNGLANVGEASPWPGRSEPSGRRPPCCTRWTHSPARYHRAAASTPTRTGTRIRTGTTRQRRHRRRTPRRSKFIIIIYRPQSRFVLINVVIARFYEVVSMRTRIMIEFLQFYRIVLISKPTNLLKSYNKWRYWSDQNLVRFDSFFSDTYLLLLSTIFPHCWSLTVSHLSWLYFESLGYIRIIVTFESWRQQIFITCKKRVSFLSHVDWSKTSLGTFTVIYET